MLRQRVNDYDMAYIEVGRGPALVCVHGSLGDFRSFAPALGPLSHRHRVIAVSLRRFFPEHWDGQGGGFSIEQHVEDLIAILPRLGAGPVDLVGHSRGGHIAFRIAERRPDLIRRLVLAEPGGELEPALAPPGQTDSGRRVHVEAAARLIAAGDIEGGLKAFIDAIDGPGAWERRPDASRQRARDNARTLLAQINEGRKPFTKAGASGIKAPTLLVGGANTTGYLPVVLKALAAHIPGAEVAWIADATHSMIDQQPARFCQAILAFLDRP